MNPATKITIFDTTLRDGELALTQKFTATQKLEIALMLDKAGVDVIEVGYPGAFPKDLDDVSAVAQQVNHAVVCGLASSQPREIEAIATALKSCVHGRINVFTPIRVETEKALADAVEMTQKSVSLARNYCDDVEWSAFDATRSHPDVVCKTVETAINAGATTIAIPDSMGIATPSAFVALIEKVKHCVPNIDQATLAVHCHDDHGHAVENSLKTLAVGTRQIECSINGLGARAGNANLAEVVEAIAQHPSFYTTINPSQLPAISKRVAEWYC
ncbi:2-isopropylmalate synthase [Vacuolonema iberomarrocanum]|uniref:2-isopropylmalate synthase n=1 Tax=Vacuolonema iberomarrocanum TaxID=3454632 RepID=UPI001A0CE054|nr:2-isopropylmalate synthase [filamentous cyanobacterium LEGE 07170]